MANPYLERARETIRYVLGRMKGANWDQWSGRPAWENGTARMDDLDQCVYIEVRKQRAPPRPTKGGDNRDNTEMVLEHGRRAILAGCGNCTEFTSAAFLYCYQHRIYPVDYMSLEKGDHRFLLLNRRGGDARMPETWNSDCIVCDPWACGLGADVLRRNGEDPGLAMDELGAYPGREIYDRMPVEERPFRTWQNWGMMMRHRIEGRLWDDRIWFNGLP